jgi:hypothetical protein
MPTADCIKYLGKMYCYDKTSKLVTVYNEYKTIKLGECPERVLEAFVENNSQGTVELDEAEYSPC